MIKFIQTKALLTFHEDQIDQYGGNRGVRDKRLLRYALERTEASVDVDSPPDIFEIAASYGFNICHNSPFFDGSKRTVLIAIYTFLYVNGARLKAGNDDVYNTIMNLSDGKLNIDDLTDFLRENCVALT